jgi:hypothetical protein
VSSEPDFVKSLCGGLEGESDVSLTVRRGNKCGLELGRGEVHTTFEERAEEAREFAGV